jgi:multidrug transporter EmrE-like cation transporter
MKLWIILLISISLTIIGQLILKKGLLVIGPIERIGLKFFQMIINPVVVLGVIFTILGWAVYVLALSKSDLSYAYPIWSLTFVIVPLLSLYIFKESISPLKINGLAFIARGIFLVAVSIK